MLDERQSFKTGFLLRCAEAGLTTEETTKIAEAILEEMEHVEAVKAAEAEKQADSYWSQITEPIAGIYNAAKGLGTAGILGSMAAGAGAGYGIAKLREPHIDPEEIKTHETIATLNHYAERARRAAQQRQIKSNPANLQSLLN